MVIPGRAVCVAGPRPAAAQRGALITELLIAMALLTGLLLPIAYSTAAERRVARSIYERAVAIEIVDGEMEALLAGERQAFSPGTHNYEVHSHALTNLAPGQFLLTVATNRVRLEWKPGTKQHGGSVVREVTFP
jgi:hypothetical protein